MLNWWALISLLATWACIFTMIFVGIKQFREVRRPKNGFTLLRYYLLFLPMIVGVGSALRIERLNQQLHTRYTGVVTRASIGGTLVIAAATLLILSIYTYRERK